MATPQSLPVIPAQPDQDTYSPSELALFKTYTRDSYRAAFGVEAPAYNPARAPQYWFDSTAARLEAGDLVLYKRFSYSDASVKQLVMRAGDAAVPNLPGAIPYPRPVLVPSSATRNGSPIWADTLSLEAEARGLLRELGLKPDLFDALFDQGEQWSNSSFPILWGSETRREWGFAYRGRIYNVARLIAEKNSGGVGAPGHWQVAETIQWVPDAVAATGLDDAREPVPVPMRELLPNESVRVAMLGMSTLILRTDRLREAAATEGGFTAADRLLLQEIRDAVVR